MQVDVDLDVSCNYVQSEFMVRVFWFHLEYLDLNWLKNIFVIGVFCHIELFVEFLDF